MNRRVLIFSTAYFPLVGGAEVAMKEITDRLSDFDFDLICAKIQPGLAKTERIGNVTVHRVGFGHPIDKLLLPFLGPFRALHLSYTLHPTPHTLPIWSLMASYGGFASLFYTWLRPKTKMLLTLQEGDPLEYIEKRVGPFMFLFRAIFTRANIVQAISRFLAKWSVDMGFKGEPVVIPNGVDVGRFGRREEASGERREARSDLPSLKLRETRKREEFGFLEEDVVLVTTSRLTLKNAVDDLIRSLVHLPAPYKALIVGIGEDEEMLRALTKELNLESRVVFAGRKTHSELPDILQNSDIFVRASLSEGLGNSFLEAMVSGIPIVGTPVGGIPDFLTDGETGVFCSPRDPKSLADAVLRIQEEPGLRERLIENGERLVREKYDWNMIARQMRDLLDRLFV